MGILERLGFRRATPPPAKLQPAAKAEAKFTLERLGAGQWQIRACVPSWCGGTWPIESACTHEAGKPRLFDSRDEALAAGRAALAAWRDKQIVHIESVPADQGEVAS